MKGSFVNRFMPAALLTIAAASSMLLLAGCGGNNALGSLGNPPVVSAQQAYSDASLSGTYSFNESGVVGNQQHDGSGVLQFDGNGNITGTFIDYYVGGTNPCHFNVTGTYTVSSSADGTATLTTTTTDPDCTGYTGGTVSLQVAQQGQSMVFAETDGQRLDTGIVLKQ